MILNTGLVMPAIVEFGFCAAWEHLRCPPSTGYLKLAIGHPHAPINMHKTTQPRNGYNQGAAEFLNKLTHITWLTMIVICYICDSESFAPYQYSTKQQIEKTGERGPQLD